MAYFLVLIQYKDHHLYPGIFMGFSILAPISNIGCIGSWKGPAPSLTTLVLKVLQVDFSFLKECI